MLKYLAIASYPNNAREQRLSRAHVNLIGLPSKCKFMHVFDKNVSAFPQGTRIPEYIIIKQLSCN